MKDKSQFDEGYERGFAAGVAHEVPDHPRKRLRERLQYLRLGGSWKVYGMDRDSYVQGFLDAMETLGVKP